MRKNCCSDQENILNLKKLKAELVFVKKFEINRTIYHKKQEYEYKAEGQEFEKNEITRTTYSDSGRSKQFLKQNVNSFIETFRIYYNKTVHIQIRKNN